jgi:hypothetical protein
MVPVSYSFRFQVGTNILRVYTVLHSRVASRLHSVHYSSTDLLKALQRIMEPTYFAQYRGFELRCSPQRVSKNSYAPRLIIYNTNAATTLEIPIVVPTPPFENPTDAARQAFEHGREWVDSGYMIAAGLVEPEPG